jgi:hypothetical protein
MIAEERIFFGMADITSEQEMKLVKQWCQTNNVIISTLYISNISEWIVEHNISKKQVLENNLQSLKDSATVIIDAFYPTLYEKKGGPPLRTTDRELPNFNKVRPTRIRHARRELNLHNEESETAKPTGGKRKKESSSIVREVSFFGSPPTKAEEPEREEQEKKKRKKEEESEVKKPGFQG